MKKGVIVGKSDIFDTKTRQIWQQTIAGRNVIRKISVDTESFKLKSCQVGTTVTEEVEVKVLSLENSRYFERLKPRKYLIQGQRFKNKSNWPVQLQNLHEFKDSGLRERRSVEQQIFVRISDPSSGLQTGTHIKRNTNKYFADISTQTTLNTPQSSVMNLQ